MKRSGPRAFVRPADLRRISFLAASVVVLLGLGLALPPTTPHGSAPAQPDPAGALPVATGPPAGVADGSNGTPVWTNLTAEAGIGPSNRQMVYEAYSPALNATVLFGGYDGYGTNVAYGDTWEFTNNTWTELSASGGPSPRFGGAMVYDAADHDLLLFGGQNLTQYFNATWIYNTTGWHEVTTATAPSPRSGFGLAYDAAMGAVVLFGGRWDLPGTYGENTFYTDTWTYRAGVWTNITATAGAAPPGGYLLGEMTYDAADGYVLLTGGIDLNLANCPLTDGGVWAFQGGRWSEEPPTSSGPPAGRGALWYDGEANTTFYYEGEENLTTGCTTYGDEVWSYAAGNWTQVAAGGTPSPIPRVNVQVVDDEQDGEQLLFGGGGPEYAEYLDDLWAFGPTYGQVTFVEHGLATGARWSVTLGSTIQTSLGAPITFRQAPGPSRYAYVVAQPDGKNVSYGAGIVYLTVRGTHVDLQFGPTAGSGAGPAGLSSALVLGLGAAAGAALGVATIVALSVARASARREGEEIVTRLAAPRDESPGRRNE